MGMEFSINIHGCQPCPKNSRLCTKSAQKLKLLLGTVPIKSLLRIQIYEWLSQEYYILPIDHLNDLNALSSLDLTLLSFRSNVYYVD